MLSRVEIAFFNFPCGSFRYVWNLVFLPVYLKKCPSKNPFYFITGCALKQEENKLKSLKVSSVD